MHNLQMDSATMERLRSHLTCPVCRNLLHEPRILPCLHNFCNSCLKKTADNKGCVSCPLCSDEQRGKPVPFDSVPTNSSFENIIGQLKLLGALRRQPSSEPTSLETSSSFSGQGAGPYELQCLTCLKDPAVAFCEDCGDSLCEDCERHHRKAVKTASHSLVVLGQGAVLNPRVTSGTTKKVARDPWHCGEHYKKLKVYCADCDRMLCRTCGARSDHEGHRRMEAQPAASLYRQKLKQQAETVRPLLLAFTGTAEHVEEVRSNLDANAQTVRRNIEERYEQLLDALTKEKEKQMRQLEIIFDSKAKTLCKQLEETDAIKQAIESSLAFADNLTGDSSFIDAEFLFLWSRVHTRLKELKQKYSQHVCGSHESSNIGYKHSPPLHLTGVLGEVYVEPSLKAFVAPDLQSAHIVKGQPYEFVISCIDITGTCSIHDGRIPQIEVRLIPDGAPTRGVVGMVGLIRNGVYKVRIVPLQSGNHSLVVRSVDDNTDVIGTVYVCVAPPMIGASPAVVVIGYDSCVHPSGIAAGRRYIAVSNIEGRIVLYGKHFQILTELTVCRDRDKTSSFDAPKGLCFDFEDNLVVAESRGHIVKVVTPLEGTLVRTIGSHGSNVGQFESPTSVAVDKVGRIFVADLHKVQYFNPDGSYLGQIVSGTEADQTADSCSITIDAQDRLLMAFHRQAKVLVLKRKTSAQSAEDPLGYQVAFTFGSNDEVEEHNLRCPTAVTVDYHYGYIYVTEEVDEGRICVYSSNGEYIHSFTDAAKHKFFRPTGICVLSNSNVIIANGDRQLIELKVLGL